MAYGKNEYLRTLYQHNYNSCTIKIIIRPIVKSAASALCECKSRIFARSFRTHVRTFGRAFGVLLCSTGFFLPALFLLSTIPHPVLLIKLSEMKTQGLQCSSLVSYFRCGWSCVSVTMRFPKALCLVPSLHLDRSFYRLLWCHTPLHRG